MAILRELTPDDPDFDSWHHVIRQAYLHEREPSWWESARSARVIWSRRASRTRHYAVAAFDGTRCVGGAAVDVPLMENTDTLSVEIGVLPSHRRRGLGSQLADYVADLAASQDRPIVQAELWSDGEAELSAGGCFAVARGMRSVSSEHRMLLELPCSERMLARADADAGEIVKHRIISFVGDCPADHVHEWARLRTAMSQDLPTGDLTREPSSVDVARIREGERNFAEQGWTRLRALALTPDGRGAGYSELLVSRFDPDFAVQDDTFVDRPHRGHRLSALLKAANLRQLQQLPSIPRWVQTHTEVQNTAMLRVNESFGFRSVDVLHEMEGHLTHLRE